MTLTIAEVWPCSSQGTCTLICPGLMYRILPGRLMLAEGTSKLKDTPSIPIGRGWLTTEQAAHSENAVLVVSDRFAPNTAIQEPGATARPAVKLAASTMPLGLLIVG